MFGYHVDVVFYRTKALFAFGKGKDWMSITLPFGVLTIETIESWEKVY